MNSVCYDVAYIGGGGFSTLPKLLNPAVDQLRALSPFWLLRSGPIRWRGQSRSHSRFRRPLESHALESHVWTIASWRLGRVTIWQIIAIKTGQSRDWPEGHPGDN